jgi:hypothetical protein
MSISLIDSCCIVSCLPLRSICFTHCCIVSCLPLRSICFTHYCIVSCLPLRSICFTHYYIVSCLPLRSICFTHCCIVSCLPLRSICFTHYYTYVPFVVVIISSSFPISWLITGILWATQRISLAEVELLPINYLSFFSPRL